MSERSPAELILAHQERLDQVNSTEQEQITAHQYLQSLYRNPNEPTSVRMRAAIKAIEVETPRISATANMLFDGATFAEMLERCIERSKSPPQLNGPTEPLPREELQRPMSRYRRF
jgi:hypothetical protein